MPAAYLKTVFLPAYSYQLPVLAVYQAYLNSENSSKRLIIDGFHDMTHSLNCILLKLNIFCHLRVSHLYVRLYLFLKQKKDSHHIGGKRPKALTVCGIKSFSFHYYVLGDGPSLYRKGVPLFQLDID